MEKPTSGLTSRLSEKTVIAIAILSLLLTASGLINILLTRKLSVYKSALTSERKLAAGQNVKPILAHKLDGTPLSISYSDSTQPTVVYVFSPQCVWCSRNLDNVKMIEKSVKGRYRFIGLTLSALGLNKYITENNISFPVYRDVDERSKVEYKLNGTPQTFVITQSGKILKSWYGAYTGDQVKEIESFFEVKLPGLK